MFLAIYDALNQCCAIYTSGLDRQLKSKLTGQHCRLNTTADGLSLWLVRRCGILCLTTCVLVVLAEANSVNI